MPRAPKRCARCETLVVGRTYCERCQPVGWTNGGHSRTSTPEHRAWRRAILERDHWTCQIAGPRCTKRAREADHIVPIAEGGSPLDLSNGQAACAECHRAKTQIEAARGRARRGAGTPPPRV